MGLITSLVIVAVLLTAFFILGFIHSKMRATKHEFTTGIGIAKYAVLAITVVPVFSIMSCAFVQVPAGHVGVVTRFGQTLTEPLREGLNIMNPINDVILMNTQVQKDEEICNCETSDTQAVSIKIIINWRPDADLMPTIYKNYGMQYAGKILPPAVKECVKAEVARYKVIDIVVERSAIHKNVEEKINIWLKKYGLAVLEVGIADIDFSDKYDAAIETKQLQEQQALQKQYELQKTETEAKMAAAQARGEAESRIAKAEGDAQSILKLATAEAESLRIRGEAQADYYKKVSESMTPIMIQAEYLKKWDGKLPIYTIGQGASPMIMIPATDK